MWPGGPTWTDPVDPNALTLSMLPLDVLRCVLVQRGVGPRELCALEQTSRLFRSLVDEETWKHAFLEHRRCNVLREPESWKLELTRRTMWSRNWRQIVGCSSASHLTSGLNLCLKGTSKMFHNSYKSFQTKMASAARLCFRPLLAR